MEKYIAFGLYRKNEHGGHQEAMEPGEAKPVYLAKDVAKVLDDFDWWIQEQLRESQFPDFDTGDGYETAMQRAREKIKALMER